MIACDKCEDWFHGKCVNITKAMGRDMEEKGIEWTCPNCKQKGLGKTPKDEKSKKVSHFFKIFFPNIDFLLAAVDTGTNFRIT